MTASKAITDLLSQLGVLQFRLVVLSIKARAASLPAVR
jgi:hypothetical protein